MWGMKGRCAKRKKCWSDIYSMQPEVLNEGCFASAICQSYPQNERADIGWWPVGARLASAVRRAAER